MKDKRNIFEMKIRVEKVFLREEEEIKEKEKK